MAYYKVITADNRIWVKFQNSTLSEQDGKFPLGTRFHGEIAGVSETGDMVIKTANLYTKRKWLEAIPEPAPVVTPDPDVPTLPEPPAGWRRYQVLHDWQSGVHNYQVRDVAPDPEVNRIGEFDDHKSHVKVKLNQQYQIFWANLIAMKRYGKILALCNSLEARYIRNKFTALSGPATAFTNRNPDALTANYITGENLRNDPPSIAPLICGGCTVWGKPVGVSSRGRAMVQIYSFIEGQVLPQVTPDLLLDPRVLWATAIYAEGYVYPFSHLAGLSVPYPLITKTAYFYPADGLQEYDGDFRSQYQPQRDYYP